MTVLPAEAIRCPCRADIHQPRFVVLTGGPSGGKSRFLDMIGRSLCRHMGVLPESATIVFGGGFPRVETSVGRRAAQRTIYHVQDQLEQFVREEGVLGLALCDRGTLDGLAYWPDDEDGFFGQLETTREWELTRYAAVIHLRTPPAESYDSSNKLRIESPGEAAELDAGIETAWRGHPRRFFIEGAKSFDEKVAAALTILRAELPPCCRERVGPDETAATCSPCTD